MGQLLRIVLVVFALWLLVRYIKRVLSQKSSHRPSPDTPARVNAMLPCKVCGVYVPQSDTIRRGEHVYCSQEHADTDDKT